jgi:hypothetical protein
MKKALYLVLAIMMFSAVGLADIARPDNSKNTKKRSSIETTMMIHLKEDAKEATLVIPRNQIQQLRAQLDELDGGSENNTATVISTGDVTRTQTIASGLFLSLAIVFGGIWFVRSGAKASRSAKTLATVTILACVGFAATFVFANAGPPPEARSITGKMFSQAVHIYGFGSGRIKLEATDKGENIDLIVPDPKSKTDNEE